MITLEDGWSQIRSEGIDVLENYLETGVAPYTVDDAGSSSSSSSSSAQDTEMEGRSSGSYCKNLSAIASQQQKVSLFRTKRYMTLYTLVYAMCTERAESNYTARLYDKHGEAIEKYLDTKVAPSLDSKTGWDLLKAMRVRWENHQIYNEWMARIFQYLDRWYVPTLYKSSLRKRGLEIFLQHVFVANAVPIRKDVLDLINQDRDGKEIDENLVRSLIKMCIDLGLNSLDLYQKHVELHLLPATQQYYTNRATDWLATGTFSEYLIKVEQALCDEERRCKSYLDGSTFPKLSAVVQRTLLSDRIPYLLAMDTGIPFLLQEERIDDLQRLYRLFGLLDNGYDPIADQFKIYILTRGTAVIDQHTAAFNTEVQEAVDPKSVKGLLQKQLLNVSVAQDFLALQDYFKDLSDECFKNDLPFQRAMKEAFGEFMNKNVGTHSMASILSSYCDQLLRRRGSAASHDSIEDTLGKVVTLFSYLCDKDLFADIYRGQLARRLLTETSTSTDAEKVMISKLKLTCGSQYTARLEGMLNDLSMATDVQTDFRNEMQSDPSLVPSTLLRDNFSVMVLTSGNWPAYQTPEVNLPTEMRHCMNVFQQWYMNIKTSHRKLSWVHHLGQVTITSRFPEGRTYDFQCNVFQACLLLLFSTEEVLSTAVIHEALGLEEMTIRKLIACFNVAKILMKAKTGNSDEFQVNDKFSSKHRLIKVPIPVQSEAHTKDKVEEDRSIAVEAAIVRVMKARKTLSHVALMDEVMNQLTLFKPNLRLIKTKIEALIERDFLARGTDPKTYVYIS